MPTWMRWFGCYWFWSVLSMEFPWLFRAMGWPLLLGGQ